MGPYTHASNNMGLCGCKHHKHHKHHRDDYYSPQARPQQYYSPQARPQQYYSPRPEHHHHHHGFPPQHHHHHHHPEVFVEEFSDRYGGREGIIIEDFGRSGREEIIIERDGGWSDRGWSDRW